MFRRIVSRVSGQEIGACATNDTSAFVDDDQLSTSRTSKGGEPTITIFLFSMSADILIIELRDSKFRRAATVPNMSEFLETVCLDLNAGCSSQRH